MIDAAGVLPCARRETWGCNWTAVGPGAPLCHSCVLVDAGGREHDVLMASLQSAQRRALYQLDVLGVPWTIGVRFIYRSTAGGDDAVIGHKGGEITLDLDEADPARREHIQASLGESYRTPLGHIRHELGHFVWQSLVASDPVRLDGFRTLFGDERTSTPPPSTPTTATPTTAAGATPTPRSTRRPTRGRTSPSHGPS